MASHTHYDNLKVPRDASTEVIRAAYRELIQQYAANQSPSADANRQMKTIHNSYSILSNPIQKNKYDQWLLEQEPARAELKMTADTAPPAKTSGPHAPPREPIKSSVRSANAPALKLVTDGDSSGLAAQEPARGRWPIYAGVGLLAVSATGWLLLSGGTTKNGDGSAVPVAQVTDSRIIPDQQYPALPAATAQPDAAIPAAQAAAVPAHDKVGIDAFIGSWQGIGDPSGVRQTLGISRKSDTRFAFRLDSKAGASIGGITGVADFENGYARFLSREYGCSIVFSIKSKVLNVSSNDCQAFYRSAATFDGAYLKPDAIKALATAKVTAAPQAVEHDPVEETPPPSAPVAVAAPVPAKPMVKLRKYTATVQDAEGNITSIELLAKDKDAARKIIRDFRGNPKVLKIKELRN